MTPVISFKDVSKHFMTWHERPYSIKTVLAQIARFDFRFGKKEHVEVFSNLSFQINAGEFVGIMGRNGAGKSTLLKLISGIYSPSSGLITVNGKVAPLLELGAGFAMELTGYENIFLNASILGFGRKRTLELVGTIIEFSELGDRINIPVKNYSSGMMVRLGFAIASHLDAPVLLFDEILAVGDAGFQKKCLGKIKELHGEGRAIILVTHSPEQVNNFCSRCILMDNKIVVFDGKPQEGKLL